LGTRQNKNIKSNWD